MAIFENQKILRNLVKLENCLILDDNFLELSLQQKIFSREMLNDIMGTDSPSLDYCMKLCRRCPAAFTQSIDILIQTKQNYIMFLLLSTT
jgi:hypothetical protein